MHFSTSSRTRATTTDVRRLVRSIGVTAAVGFAYFLIAELGLGLYGQTNWVSVFWPAFGVSAGALIGLGPGARLQVAIGVITAIVVAHLIVGDPLWLGPTFALSDAAEALVAAGLIQHYFGAAFSLGRLRHVLSLLGAAAVGSLASFAVWIVPSRVFQDSTEPILITWQHWFIGDMVGFVALGPFVIGVFAAVRQPPPRRELLEGAAALAGLALMTAIIISVPKETWETLLPVAWLFPMLFWLAARCRPVFAAAGVCIVSIAVVWTTVFGIGHFGDSGLPVEARNLQAQTTIFVVALGAFVLAALFAERKESEARLAYSKTMLERERDNKLMNMEAMAASIAHEVRQPLTGITGFASSALRYLGQTPPNLARAESVMNKVIVASQRASEILDNIRALFGKAEIARDQIDVNELVLEVLRALDADFKRRRIATNIDLAPELPRVSVHKVQLQEVIINLVNNAMEAMDLVDEDHRMLKLRTELGAEDTITIAVEDTGPGFGSEKSDDMFDAFVTTKPHGTGLGLAICRTIVDRHGGQLSASPAHPQGAIVRFTLPRTNLTS